MLAGVKNFLHASQRAFVAALLGDDYRYSWLATFLLSVSCFIARACVFTGVTLAKIFATMTSKNKRSTDSKNFACRCSCCRTLC